ncbi:MAG: ATP-binding protein, partial [Bacteroidota bacterium]|nr:ATP-binding protein [Bacteroidota bacterium]
LSFLNAVYQTIQTLPKMIYFARFEIGSTAIITTLYLIQHSGALQLKKHKKNLEIIVSQRTKSLASANEELQSTIEELNRKNKKLTETFDHLKKTQVKLIEKEKMASLGILTSGVAHEINNPLNYIIGACYGLQEHFESTKTGTESTNTFLSALETGVNRASEIVKSLSQFSRDKEDYDEECNIHSIIDNSVIMLNNKLKYKAEIIKNYTDSNCVIKGNVGKLHQVFINIINNACQAIEKKGHITISTKLKNDLFIVKIADGGAGIPEEIIDKIKDPFYTTKEAGEGTGLGLSISDSIIKNHGGILHITSEQNKGTEITIKLPYTNE